MRRFLLKRYFFVAFVSLQYGFVIFYGEKISKKALFKMLLILTKGFDFYQHFKVIIPPLFFFEKMLTPTVIRENLFKTKNAFCCFGLNTV